MGPKRSSREAQTPVSFESCGDHVIDSRQQLVRQAYDAARTALGAMITADGPNGPSAVSVSGGVTASSVVSGTSTQMARARDGWNAAEQLLQTITGHPELSGQSVIAEARRQQRLSLADAHALAALYGWIDRAAANPEASSSGVETERTIAREALEALDHGMQSSGIAAAPEAAAAGGASAYIDSVAALAQPPRDRTQQDWSGAPPPQGGASPRPSGNDGPGFAQASPPYADNAADDRVRRPRRGVDTRLILGSVAVLLVALLAYAGWTMFDDRNTESLYQESVTAYQSGGLDAAQAGFARVAQDRPDDVRPLIFLGRIAREQNDMQRSRRFLEAAIKQEPANALAQRELAGTLLADGQPELARRFYVRAVELDPSDRTAQGFLGCALHRLARFDEARRWFDRAGTGDWLRCITPMQPMAPMPGQYPQQPVTPYPAQPPR
jgi:tetratricopeptide (TPR) repeat protein